jgi:hypothetical protein
LIRCFTELPTAFHALLGIALFLFANVVAQEPCLLLEGEPAKPTPHWLATLDVFEMGENLPNRTGSRTRLAQLPEDWHMAIVWGQTLVCLADELVNLQSLAPQKGLDPLSVTLDIEEPKWPEQLLLHAIAVQRQPVTHRMSPNTATPNDLLVLAMDQFSCGIFHMPHPQNQPFALHLHCSSIITTTSHDHQPQTVYVFIRCCNNPSKMRRM